MSLSAPHTDITLEGGEALSLLRYILLSFFQNKKIIFSAEMTNNENSLKHFSFGKVNTPSPVTRRFYTGQGLDLKFQQPPLPLAHTGAGSSLGDSPPPSKSSPGWGFHTQSRGPGLTAGMGLNTPLMTDQRTGRPAIAGVQVCRDQCKTAGIRAAPTLAGMPGQIRRHQAGGAQRGLTGHPHHCTPPPHSTQA